MNRRFCKSLSLWIVPLLLLRTLIPTGFMLAADANGLSLVFCSVSVPAAGSAAVHDGHAGHHAGQNNDQNNDVTGEHSGAHGNHGSASQHNAPCPFSLAAVGAVGEIPYLVSTAAIPVDERFEFLSAPIFSVGPLRTQCIRGPPSLA